MAPGDNEVHQLLEKILTLKTQQDARTLKAMTRLVALLKDDNTRMEELASYPRHCDVIERLLIVIGQLQNESAQAALQVLVYFLHQENVCKNLDAEHIFESLCQTLQKADEKQICIRIVWCMEKQEFPIKAFDNFRKFDAVFNVMKRLLRRENMSFTSSTLDFEIGGVLKRFLSQCPFEMFTRVDDWIEILIILSMNPSRQVHDVAMEIFAEYKPQIDDRRPLAAFCLTNLEKLLVPNMKKLLLEKGREQLALDIWRFFLELLGKEAHQRSVINKLLFVVEHAFKNPEAQIKMAAFRSWTALMDSFSTNATVLNNNKHIRLLMQPFLVNNAKTEEIALAKLEAWWYLTTLLREQIGEHFDLVLSPLLCFACGLPMSPITTAAPSRIGALSPSVTMPSFPTVQLRGCEALVLILESSDVRPPMPKNAAVYSFTLPMLADGVKVMSSPQRFLKYHKTLIMAARKTITDLRNKMPAALLYRMFSALVGHMDVLVTSLGWTATSPAAVTFMTSFEEIVTSTALEDERIMRLFRTVCLLPDKFLCCQQFSTGEERNSCPALNLIELLLSRRMLEVCEPAQMLEIFTDLVKMAVSHAANMLKFSQSALSSLERSAERVDDEIRVFQLWSSLAKALHDEILKTNEVNQGDALEHDFSCMYGLLEFPVARLLNGSLSQPYHASLNKLWSELYATFARLAALVPNAPPNTCVDQLASRLLTTSSSSSSTGGVASEKAELSSLASLCVFAEAMVTSVDYSTFSNQRPTAFLSPSKFVSPTHKRAKPLGNLHHLVRLLATLLDRLTALCERQSTPSNGKTVNETGGALLRAIMALVHGVTSPTTMTYAVYDLTYSLAGMLEKSSKVGDRKSIFGADLLLKIQNFWSDLTKVLGTRFTGARDSEFLHKVAPLFTATLQHQRKQVKTASLSLWSSWFGSAEPLDYPDELRAVLCKLKDKQNISLPGFRGMEDVEDVVAMETTVSESQLTQGESQVPLPDNLGIPSPAKKVHGSFLSRIVSPSKTPEKEGVAKRQATPFARPARADDSDFVVIAPEPKRKLVLTDHQKEVLRQKSALPTMYNNLDASVDTSLHTEFFSEQSQSTQSQKDSQDASFSILGERPATDKSSKRNPASANVSTPLRNIGNKEKSKDDGKGKKVHFSDDSDLMILSQKNEKEEIEISDTPMEIGEAETPTQLSLSQALSQATGKTKPESVDSEKPKTKLTENEEAKGSTKKKRNTKQSQSKKGKTSNPKTEIASDPFSKAKRATPLKTIELISQTTPKTLKLNSGKELISSQVGFASQNEEAQRIGHDISEKDTSKDYRRSLSPRILDLGAGGDAKNGDNRKNVDRLTPENISEKKEWDSMTDDNSMKAANSVLVEDTQSPEKFKAMQRRRLSTTESSDTEANDSVAETPEKCRDQAEIDERTPENKTVVEFSLSEKRTKKNLDSKLFSDSTSESDSVYDADTEVVPDSQRQEKEPKVILKKLTSSQILNYSPEKCSNQLPLATRVKRKSLLGVSGDSRVFEAGVSSSEDIVPCSQGFEIVRDPTETTEHISESSQDEKTLASSGSKTAKNEGLESKEEVANSESELLTSDEDMFETKTKAKVGTDSSAKDDRAARELKKLSIDMVAISVPRGKKRRSVRERVASPFDESTSEKPTTSGDQPMSVENSEDRPISEEKTSEVSQSIDASDQPSKEDAKPDQPITEPVTKTDENSAKNVNETESIVKETVEENIEEKMEEEVFVDAVQETKTDKATVAMAIDATEKKNVPSEIVSKPETIVEQNSSKKSTEKTVPEASEEIVTELGKGELQSPEKIGNPELPETPKSCGNNRVSRRRFASAQKSPAQSRGLRLLALAKQSNLTNKEKTSPKREVRRPGSAMTDPVKRRPMSRVDIILSRSRKALHKSMAAADVTSGSSGDDVRSDVDEKPLRLMEEGRVPSGLSPVMSPGSGILKKRKFDHVCDSPSPPMKHRRVSFAANDDVRFMSEHGDLDLRIKSPMSESKFKVATPETPRPSVNRCLELTRAASPLIDRGRKVKVSSSKSVMSAGAPETEEELPEEPIPEMVEPSAATPASQSPNTELTPQSGCSMEMDNTEPFFERLAKSQIPLREVVGQLTSTMWSHSLKECFKTRGLNTVGDLAKLTEYEIHRLPGIKSPRVETVRNLLQRLLEQNEATELAVKSMSPIKPSESPPRSLPSAEEALDSLSPAKDTIPDELDETIEMEQPAPSGVGKNSPAVSLRMDTDDEQTSSQEGPTGNPDEDKIDKNQNDNPEKVTTETEKVNPDLDDDSTMDSVDDKGRNETGNEDDVVSFRLPNVAMATLRMSSSEEVNVVEETDCFKTNEKNDDVEMEVLGEGPMTSTQVDVSPDVRRRRSSRRLRDQSQAEKETRRDPLDQSGRSVNDNVSVDEESRDSDIVPNDQSRAEPKSRDASVIVIDQSESPVEPGAGTVVQSQTSAHPRSQIVIQSGSSEDSVRIGQSGALLESRGSLVDQSVTSERSNRPIVIDLDTQDSQDTNNNHLDSKDSSQNESLWHEFDTFLKRILASETSETPTEAKKLEILLELSQVQTKLLSPNLPSTSAT